MPQNAFQTYGIDRGISSSLNLTAGSTVLKATPGRMCIICINTVGTALSWKINDCTTIGAITAANLIWSALFSDSNVAAGQVVTLEFPCKVGIVITVPTSGVGSVSWI